MFTMSRYRLCFLHLSVVFTMKDVEVCEEVARYINVYIYISNLVRITRVTGILVLCTRNAICGHF